MTPEEFNLLVRNFKDKLFRYAFSMLGDHGLSEDVVQEVFVKLWQQKQKITKPQAWCITACRNLILDQIKANKIKAIQIDYASEKSSALLADKQVEQQELKIILSKLIEKLPEKQREIFRLKEISGYSNSEIQEILGLDETQVKVYLFRARQKIKRSIHSMKTYGFTA